MRCRSISRSGSAPKSSGCCRIRTWRSFHGNDGWVLPIPATFVVGRDGLVKARFVDPDFRKRMEIDDLIAALKNASRELGEIG